MALGALHRGSRPHRRRHDELGTGVSSSKTTAMAVLPALEVALFRMDGRQPDSQASPVAMLQSCMSLQMFVRGDQSEVGQRVVRQVTLQLP